MERYKQLRDDARAARSAERRKEAALKAFPHFKKFIEEQPTNIAYAPASSGVEQGSSGGTTFGERKSEGTKKPSKKPAFTTTDDDIDMDADGRFEMSWTPGDIKGKAKDEGDKPKKGAKEKEKKKKGVESFGAGLEKGIAQETAEDLSEAQRHGRTQKRNKLRSASRNTFRGLTK